jgi:hypothetical protein
MPLVYDPDCWWLEEIEMAHYCRICGRDRPNEQFSGKGHNIHVCKRCKIRPKSERQAIEDQGDIFGFLQQSHISERNVARLEQMVKADNLQVANLAAIVLDVARVKPYKAGSPIGWNCAKAESRWFPVRHQEPAPKLLQLIHTLARW